MKTHRRALSYAAVVLVVALLGCGSGCSPKYPKALYTQDVTFKFGDGFIKFHALDRRIALLVCCRFDGKERGGGGGPAEGGGWHDYFETSTGRIELIHAHQDGEQDHVRINGEQYDLTKGQVFLLSLQRGRCRVVQLHRELSGIASEEASVKQFVEQDPDLARFMKEWRFPD